MCNRCQASGSFMKWKDAKRKMAWSLYNIHFIKKIVIAVEHFLTNYFEWKILIKTGCPATWRPGETGNVRELQNGAQKVQEKSGNFGKQTSQGNVREFF